MMEEVRFRAARSADVPAVMEIIRQAKEQMRRAGSCQWQEGYPAITDIRGDLTRGIGCVLEYDGCVIAYGAVVWDGEPAYESIDGAWIGHFPYVMVHRLAVAEGWKRRGVATLFMRRTEEWARDRGLHSFRVDTNFDNLYMLKMLSRLGFCRCGEVKYGEASRLAFEKVW